MRVPSGGAQSCKEILMGSEGLGAVVMTRYSPCLESCVLWASQASGLIAMQIFSLEVCFCMFKIGVHLSFEILFLQNRFQLWPPNC